jgi:hypothetical protein
MAYTYAAVAPWGRSFEEYLRMFQLGDDELQLKILGCADGPAGFNAEMAERGHRVVSCDPLYQFSKQQIEQRIDDTYDNILAQTRDNEDLFVWSDIRSIDELGRMRRASMNEFLADYDRGKCEGRYVAAEVPALPFAAQTFDLAICSHFLFLYSPILSLEFHQEAIAAMCTVAREVRIFPLLTYNAEPSPYVTPIIAALKESGRSVSVERVAYEFQRGANEMLRVCEIS